MLLAPVGVSPTVGFKLGAMKIIEPRPVPLGGLRAMTVRRLLPAKERRMVGAWCFIDHYGPDDVAVSGGMRVAPHPHTGLQTASWIFTGTIEHRDSLGTVADVRPGELNLMTAGYGINHSEYSTPDTSVLHGIQLWIALPAEHKDTDPAFESFVPQPLDFPSAGSVPVQVRVFLGELGVSVDGTSLRACSPVKTYSPLLGAEVLVGEPGSVPGQSPSPAPDAPSRRMTLHLNPAYEHGLVVDAGAVRTEGKRVEAHQMLFLEAGTTSLELEVLGDARLILLGGEPFGEAITMWWNFIGRTHEDIVAAWEAWQEQVEAYRPHPAPEGAEGSAVMAGAAPAAGRGGHSSGGPRYGGVVLLPEGYGEEPAQAVIPAPALPPVRLKPRGD